MAAANRPSPAHTILAKNTKTGKYRWFTLRTWNSIPSTSGDKIDLTKPLAGKIQKGGWVKVDQETQIPPEAMGKGKIPPAPAVEEVKVATKAVENTPEKALEEMTGKELIVFLKAAGKTPEGFENMTKVQLLELAKS